MITTTTKVAKKVIKKSGRGSVIFNDKLIDGRRSLKVWGWGETEYLKAKKKLEKKGCTVKVVKVKTYAYGRGVARMQTRLHVAEPSM